VGSPAARGFPLNKTHQLILDRPLVLANHLANACLLQGVTVDLARNVISIAPLISLVAIAVTFGQADLINGATLIRWVAIAVTFGQAELINGVALISPVAIAITFGQAELINAAMGLSRAVG
jgi:hypothetical protein